MLDDFGNELDSTDSKIDSTMKKVAKVLHMNNGKQKNAQRHSINSIIKFAILFRTIDNRQWTAIIVLSIVLLLVILLFILL